MADADLVVIQTNHPEFLNLDLAQVFVGMRPGGVIYDLWGLHGGTPIALGRGVRYTALGAVY